MSTQRYSVTPHPIETILTWVKSGEIAIPEIQRPFVWEATKVRNLLDSLYQGYPVGYLIAWRNPTVKLKDGSPSLGKRILIDGQQRVTALMAGLLGREVLTKDYETIRIRIAFHPQTEKFEVANPAIRKDVAWVEDVAAVLAGKPDPGYTPAPGKAPKPDTVASDAEDASLDLGQAAHDQIVAHIQSRFSGHGLARLVDAVLTAEGWVTKLSPPGADGGVDIFAGRGSLGLDQPRLCVQVKSQASPVDVTVYRTLQGSMQRFKAEQGLLVAWGGFNKVVLIEAKQGYFAVRLWESRDLVEAVYRNYERLPAEIQAELPLKRVWMLVHEEPET
jgi:hypothetical protein